MGKELIVHPMHPHHVTLEFSLQAYIYNQGLITIAMSGET